MCLLYDDSETCVGTYMCDFSQEREAKQLEMQPEDQGSLRRKREEEAKEEETEKSSETKPADDEAKLEQASVGACQ